MSLIFIGKFSWLPPLHPLTGGPSSPDNFYGLWLKACWHISIPLGAFCVVPVPHSTCCVGSYRSLLQFKISLSTYCPTKQNNNENPQQKKRGAIAIERLPILYISIFLTPEPCHLGLGFHPPLNFKVKSFHKWSALAWENCQQSQKGEVSGAYFSMGHVVSSESAFDLLSDSKDSLSLT